MMTAVLIDTVALPKNEGPLLLTVVLCSSDSSWGTRLCYRPCRVKAPSCAWRIKFLPTNCSGMMVNLFASERTEFLEVLSMLHPTPGMLLCFIDSCGA